MSEPAHTADLSTRMRYRQEGINFKHEQVLALLRTEIARIQEVIENNKNSAADIWDEMNAAYWREDILVIERCIELIEEMK